MSGIGSKPEYGQAYSPPARVGAVVLLSPGVYRVRGMKRWWVLNLTAGACECDWGNHWPSRKVDGCLHRRLLQEHLDTEAGLLHLAPSERTNCTRCGQVIRVPPRGGFRNCADCKWRYQDAVKAKKAAGEWMPTGEWRSTSPAAKTPTTADLHWAAGFLEGEGCFSSAGGRSRKATQRIAACQTEAEPLLKLRELFGGRVSQVSNSKSRKAQWNQQWIWKVSGPRARGVQMTLFRLLSERRQGQIRAAMQGTGLRGEDPKPERKTEEFDDAAMRVLFA